MKKINLNVLRDVFAYASPYKIKFNGIILWAISLSIFAALRPYLLKQTVDLYIIQKDLSGLIFYISFMAIVLVLEVVSQFYFAYWANWLGQNIVKDLRMKLYQKLNSFKVSYFDNVPIGKVLTRTVSDMESISKIFSQGFFMIVSELMKMIVVLFIMFYINFRLSLIVVSCMPLLILATRVFQIKMKKAFREIRIQIADLNTFVQERISGMSLLQLFNREEAEYKNFKSINYAHYKAWNKNILYNSIFFPISDLVTSIALGTVIWYGGFSIINDNYFTSFGDLFAYTMLINILFNPLRHIADKFNEMQMGLISAERIFEIIKDEKQIEINGDKIAKPLTDKIIFKDVHFSYIKGTEILKCINFQIMAGQTIAFVGATGAGKSTIINLLNRFYVIDSGSISIDGTDINEFELSSLRKQISVVQQDVFLFSDTIMNNILMGNKNISRETVMEAAKKIGINDFIESLPNAYDYNVMERGLTLSSGQRQLIAFLRAYIYNPNILILDEATSSVDTYSEELIKKATKEITANRTSIIIAHRLSTIVNVDLIIVMENGQIVEKGNHQSLINIENGYYNKLYNSIIE